MTDEQMDARLRAAGDAWRAGTATAAEDVATADAQALVPPRKSQSRRHRAGLLASAALVAAALVVGGSVLIANVTGTDSDRRPGTVIAGPARLTDTSWTLIAIKDATGSSVPLAGTAELAFGPDGGVKGRDGCNYIGAVVKLGDRTLDFGAGLAATAMACAPRQVMTTAQYVDRVLRGQVAWRIDGHELTLTKDGVGTLVYRGGESTASTDVSLLKTRWRLTTIEHGTGPGGTASSVVTDVVLSVPGDGSVTISHRCYVDTGDAQVAGNTLDISHKRLKSAIPCAATPTQQQEQQENQLVDDVLTGESAWSITQGRLRIAKNGVGALVFAPSTGGRSSAKHPGR